MAAEFWLHAFPPYEDLYDRARRAEEDGWTGILLPENQYVTPDPYVVLASLAGATRVLRLGQGCSNPGTRHPALHASQAASLQWVTGGRALFGLGRGDSAHAFLGRPPMPVREFETYVREVQRYLRGETVAVAGAERRIEWLSSSGLPKVPLDISATGPRVIAIAAVHADRISFNIGASSIRIQRAVALARSAREEAGLDPAGIGLGAFVNLAVHPDPRVARDMVRGGVSGFARFSGMAGKPLDDVPAEDRGVMEALLRAYDMDGGHGQAKSPQAMLLDDGFIDRFAVVGSAQQCVDRLAELAGLGLGHFVITPQSRFSDARAVAESLAQVSECVLPALNACPAARAMPSA